MSDPGVPSIYGGVGPSQTEGRYCLYIGTRESLSEVFGTLPQIRQVIDEMISCLEQYEHPENLKEID